MVGEPRKGWAIALGTVMVIAGGLWTPAIQGATLDPCTGTLGAATAGDHVCYDGSTIAIAPREASNAQEHTEHNTTFVRFSVENLGKYVVAQNGTGDALELELHSWTDLLPSNGTDVSEDPSYPLARVHLLTPLNPLWESGLEQEGLTVHAPLGSNWYLANVSDASISDVEALAYVDSVAAYDSSLKIQPGLGNVTGDVNVTVIALPRQPGSHANATQAIEDLGGNVTVESPAAGLSEARVNATNVSKLADEPSVLWVGFASNQTRYSADDARWVTGVPGIRDNDAIAHNFTGENITGMVSDSKIDRDHPDLASSLAKAYPEEPEGFDGDSSEFRHGTLVFGTLFADGEHAVNGGTPPAGMIPEATGIFHRNAEYVDRDLRNDNARKVADNHPISLATYSWGEMPKLLDETEWGSYNAYSWDTDYTAWEHGLLVTQAMGNWGTSGMHSEASAKNAVSVGGIFHQNNTTFADDQWWNESCRNYDPPCPSTGPTSDGRIKPDLVAPYEAIRTTSSESGGIDSTKEAHGTSMSTPIVAGAGALAQEMHKAGVFRDPSADPTQGIPSGMATKALLISAAHSYPFEHVQMPEDAQEPTRPRDGENGTEDYYLRDVQGWGVPSVWALYDNAGEVIVADRAIDLITGSTYKVIYDLNDTAEFLDVALTWSEPPNSPSVAKQVANDLDLVVEAPDGTRYPGNAGLENDTTSDPAADPLLQADRVNNVETVRVPVDDTGNWTIKVKALGVETPANPSTSDLEQPFGLVIHPVLGSSDSPDFDGSGDDPSTSDRFGDTDCNCLKGDDGAGDSLRTLESTPAFRDTLDKTVNE